MANVLTSSQQPLVSVLTPVYNGEKYLAECIESVIAQTYQKWEYIIVNNCSTDRTLEIAQHYAHLDARIRIHNNRTFVGILENHNIAFRQMSAESGYCKVVHADDWLFPECLRQMVELAEAHPAVGLVGAYGLRGSRVVWDGLPYPSTVLPGREVCRRTLLGGFYVFGSPTSHMIRALYVRKYPQFYQASEFSVAYSDQTACFRTLQDSDFGFVHQVLTYTREHEESMTNALARTGLYSDFPSLLYILTQFGPVYLSREEYEKRLKQVMGRYYRFLSWMILQRKDKQFWDYHKRALNDVGHPFQMGALLKALPLEIVDLLLNPKPIAAKMFRKVFRLAIR